MPTVSILIPFFITSSLSHEHILSQTKQLFYSNNQLEKQKQLNLNLNLKLYQLKDNKIAIQIGNTHNFGLTFLDINKIIEDNEENKKKIQLLENMLKQYYQLNIYENTINSNNNNNISNNNNNNINNINNNPSSISNSNHNYNYNIDSLLKKAKKYKQLKQQNIKLKKLLQVQLQNTQKMRQQTQKTMKILRQEFDSLVLQIANNNKQKYQKYQAMNNNHFNEQNNHININNNDNNVNQTNNHNKDKMNKNVVIR